MHNFQAPSNVTSPSTRTHTKVLREKSKRKYWFYLPFRRMLTPAFYTGFAVSASDRITSLPTHMAIIKVQEPIQTRTHNNGRNNSHSIPHDQFGGEIERRCENVNT